MSKMKLECKTVFYVGAQNPEVLISFQHFLFKSNPKSSCVKNTHPLVSFIFFTSPRPALQSQILGDHFGENYKERSNRKLTLVGT